MLDIKTKPNGQQEDIYEAVLRENGFIDPFVNYIKRVK